MFSRNLWEYDFTPATVHPERFHEPSKWKAPRKVFVCSMGDLFHHKVVAQKWEALFTVWSIMGQLPRHTFIVLTKRPEMAYSQLHPMGDLSVHLQRQDWCKTWPLPNVWVGTTVENQEQADLRIPALLQIPAAVRWVSCEPLLGPIHLDPWYFRTQQTVAERLHHPGALDWVVAGPETGPGKRPCEWEWLESLMLDCHDAEIPFFLKKFADGRPVTPDRIDLRQYPEVHHA